MSVSKGIIKQSDVMWPALAETLDKARGKSLGAVFEGANLLARIVFGSDGVSPLSGSRVIFINLFIADKQTHLRRLRARQNQGAYGMTIGQYERKYIDNLEMIRKANTVYREDANSACRNYPNAHVISVDNGKSVRDTLKVILHRIRRIRADI